eukprot:TRINITY_DN26058_c0_g1_i3.p1 TRINITY_DN26058_c0_g1~~TRINITY_DN26058_c0_g1_i3.p1  ORF type:complete len:229 (+),score=-15.96 TRINITY_DN26058_c0_g1_i3:119-805(+)
MNPLVKKLQSTILHFNIIYIQNQERQNITIQIQITLFNRGQFIIQESPLKTHLLYCFQTLTKVSFNLELKRKKNIIFLIKNPKPSLQEMFLNNILKLSKLQLHYVILETQENLFTNQQNFRLYKNISPMLHLRSFSNIFYLYFIFKYNLAYNFFNPQTGKVLENFLANCQFISNFFKAQPQFSNLHKTCKNSSLTNFKKIITYVYFVKHTSSRAIIKKDIIPIHKCYI